MSIRQRIAEFFNSRPVDPPATSPSTSDDMPLREAAGKTIEDEDEGWRRLTGDARRNLSPLTQSRMQDLAVYLWKSNPLANRMIELPVAFLLAEGVRLTCPDEEAQEWLTAFWTDPINRMDLKLAKRVRELAIFGEQCARSGHACRRRLSRGTYPASGPVPLVAPY